MKKGFTLSETVVALAVILVIVLAFYSFANFSRAAHQRTMATNFGILQVENIKNIFDASTFQQNNFQNFQSHFAEVYDDVNINISANSCDFVIYTTLDGGQSSNGDVACKFEINIANNWATLSGAVEYNNKIVFEMQPYQKAVA